MHKTILFTGATDGIGLEAAKALAAQGHTLLLHGRNTDKLLATREACGDNTEIYQADLSDLTQTAMLAKAVTAKHPRLDVLINNAGVLKTERTQTPYGIDVRFVVNTLAPYLLTQALLPLMPKDGRVINLSSAAQNTVDMAAIAQGVPMADMEIYAQSKLALTMWTNHLATTLGGNPMMVSVNPGSLLATKMVKEGFGMEGNDIGIGRDILLRAATSEDFANANGQYFDNDLGAFGPPHADALDAEKCAQVHAAVKALLATHQG